MQKGRQSYLLLGTLLVCHLVHGENNQMEVARQKPSLFLSEAELVETLSKSPYDPNANALMKRLQLELADELQTAKNYLELGFYCEAQEKLETLLDRYPCSPVVLITLGKIHQRKCESGRAFEYFKRACALFPEDSRIHAGLADYFLFKDCLKEASCELEHSFTISPDNEEACEVKEKLCGVVDNKRRLANDYIKKAEGIQELDPVKEIEQDPDEFDRAKKRKGPNELGLSCKERVLDQAVTAAVNEKLACAIALYEQIVQVEPPENEDLLTLAELNLSVGSICKAVHVYRRYLILNPNDQEVRMELVRLFLREGMWFEARQELQKMQEDPYFFYGRERLSILAKAERSTVFHEAQELVSQKRFCEAIPLYLKLVEEEPENRYYQFSLGLAYYKLEDFDSALHCFSHVLVEDPEHVEARALTARIYLRDKNYVCAEGQAKLALEQDPYFAEANWVMATIAQRRNQKADYYYLRAIDRSPDQAELRRAYATYLRSWNCFGPSYVQFKKSFCLARDIKDLSAMISLRPLLSPSLFTGWHYTREKRRRHHLKKGCRRSNL